MKRKTASFKKVKKRKKEKREISVVNLWGSNAYLGFKSLYPKC